MSLSSLRQVHLVPDHDGLLGRGCTQATQLQRHRAENQVRVNPPPCPWRRTTLHPCAPRCSHFLVARNDQSGKKTSPPPQWCEDDQLAPHIDRTLALLPSCSTLLTKLEKMGRLRLKEMEARYGSTATPTSSEASVTSLSLNMSLNSSVTEKTPLTLSSTSGSYSADGVLGEGSGSGTKHGSGPRPTPPRSSSRRERLRGRREAVARQQQRSGGSPAHRGGSGSGGGGRGRGAVGVPEGEEEDLADDEQDDEMKESSTLARSTYSELGEADTVELGLGDAGGGEREGAGGLG